MDKQLYLSEMERGYPREYSVYAEALKTGNVRKSAEALNGIYGFMSDAEKKSAFGIKLGLDLTVLSYHMGDRAKALKLGKRCLNLANKNKESFMLPEAEYVMGWLLVRAYRTEAAMQHLRKCVSAAEALGDVSLAAWALVELAQSAIDSYDQRYALELLQKALKAAKKNGEPLLELYIYLMISTLYNDITDLKAAYTYIEKALERLKALKEDQQAAEALSGVANILEPEIITRYAIICLRSGRLDEAVSTARAAGEENRERPVNIRKILFMIASFCRFVQGSEDEALDYALLAIKEEAAYHTRPYNEAIYLSYGLMKRLLDRGMSGEALELIKFTAETIENSGSAFDRRLLWRMYAEYYGALGDAEGKTRALEQYMLYMEAYNNDRIEKINAGIRSQIRLDEQAKRSERRKLAQQKKLTSMLAEREAAEFLSDHDALTGLYTRNRLKKDREGELYKNMASCGVVFFDVNDLKLTNDVYGHEVGDAMISNFAKSLRIFDDERYRAYRIGGDEFIMIIRDCEDYELDIAMEKWHAELDRINEEADIKCQVAAGFAFGSGAIRIDELLRKADERMYENKRGLKNRQTRTDRLKELSRN